MTSTPSLIEPARDAPSNVIPLWPTGHSPRKPGSRPGGSRLVQAHPIDVNAVEQEPQEQRLARRLERVLCALLYHSVRETNGSCDWPFHTVEARVGQLASREQLTAISRAAITLDWTADLTRLAAAVIALELRAQSRWRNRMLRPFSARHRQIRADTLAIARLLAWDLDVLNVRPIDKLITFL